MHVVSLIAVLACFITTPCTAAVNKCTDGRGKVTYQDEPCATPPQSAKVETSNAVGTRPAGTPAQPSITRALPAGDDPDFRSAKGAWHGPAQFHFALNGVRSAEAHAIGRLDIDLQPDGRIRGTIEEHGCKLSGLHTQFVSPANASVDVMLSGCQDSRYTGHLVANAGARESTLRLSAIAVAALATKVSQASIDAVLRR